MTFESLAKHLRSFRNEQRQDYTDVCQGILFILHAPGTGRLIFITKSIHLYYSERTKRADHYEFLHVDIVIDPLKLEYKFTEFWPGKFSIDFILGFKVPTRINDYFKQILDHLSEEHKINLVSRHPSLNKYKIRSDFRLVHIDRRVVKNLDLGIIDRTAINMYYRIKQLGLSDINAFGLDANIVTIEKIPLTIPSSAKVPVIRKLS